jgi:phosphatidylserine decarboxylase
MLVGSIGWSKKPGDKILKGEELGWFQVSAFPQLPSHQD